jgi:hypothetical protein
MMLDNIDESILSVLRKAIRDLMNERADHVAGGGCTDFSDYKHHTGFIEGLAFAERELLDLVERAQRAD